MQSRRTVAVPCVPHSRRRVYARHGHADGVFGNDPRLRSAENAVSPCQLEAAVREPQSSAGVVKAEHDGGPSPPDLPAQRRPARNGQLVNRLQRKEAQPDAWGALVDGVDVVELAAVGGHCHFYAR